MDELNPEILRIAAQTAADGDAPPAERMAAAAVLLDGGEDYHAVYECLLSLYAAGYDRETILATLDEAFYAPNEEELRERYAANCAALRDYPYLFRKDFPAFEDLPIRFYPCDDGQYYPFDRAGALFLPLAVPGEKRIRRHFFRDLERPIRAEEIVSHYELSYLNDCVRPSEWVGRENHVYLCYGSWESFCAWLQVLELAELLGDRKFVFLFGGEREEYPIDFRSRFGVDYGACPLRPLRISEICRLIVHVQLSSHNGGDFFNQVFDEHPNLICSSSVMLSTVEAYMAALRELLERASDEAQVREALRSWNRPELVSELYALRHPTDRELFAAVFLSGALQDNGAPHTYDPASRIAPALFFQPHFPNITVVPRSTAEGDLVPVNESRDRLLAFPPLAQFPYVKAFTPLRRFTASYGGALRYALYMSALPEANRNGAYRVGDMVLQRVLNRSFMTDPDDALLADAVVVRLEDGKLHPRATFSALCAFLDLPYTESMTYCSEGGARDPGKDWQGYAAGFSLDSLHPTYPDYTARSERIFIEYFLRDAYRRFGYAPRDYDGSPMDAAKMEALLADFGNIDRAIEQMQRNNLAAAATRNGTRALTAPEEAEIARRLGEHMELIRAQRRVTVQVLMLSPRFVNAAGKPLQMPRLLLPDPARTEPEVYD